MTELLYKEEVFTIVGAAIEVYNVLGTGFLEPVYQEALALEFTARNIPFEEQTALPIFYKGRLLRKTYVADYIVLGKIIVEIKSIDHLASREEAQLLNYLKATGLELGVLINFGAVGKLEWKRMVKTSAHRANQPK
jgi:GxxExxY protein